jgi:hypothetical protein
MVRFLWQDLWEKRVKKNKEEEKEKRRSQNLKHSVTFYSSMNSSWNVPPKDTTGPSGHPP